MCSMASLFRAISAWLALSWLARSSLPRTSCSCLTLSGSTACLKAARSRAIDCSCNAKSEGSAPALGVASCSRVCVGGEGDGEGAVAVSAEDDHHQAAPEMDAANTEPTRAKWRQS